MRHTRISSLAGLTIAFSVALLCVALTSTAVRGANGSGLLTGTVKSASGEKMAGIASLDMRSRCPFRDI